MFSDDGMFTEKETEELIIEESDFLYGMGWRYLSPQKSCFLEPFSEVISTEIDTQNKETIEQEQNMGL